MNKKGCGILKTFSQTMKHFLLLFLCDVFTLFSLLHFPGVSTHSTPGNYYLCMELTLPDVLLRHCLYCELMSSQQYMVMRLWNF
jgi:hypothetical protein